MEKNIVKKTSNKVKETENDESLSFFNLGKEFFKQEKYKKAIDCFLKSIEADSTNEKAYKRLGDSYYRLKHYHKAEKYYLKAIELKPSYVKAFNCLGRMYHGLKEYDKYERCYLRAIELNPKEADFYNSLGNIYGDQKRYNKAEECYLKAIELDSACMYAHYNMGCLSRNIKKYEEAEKYCLKAIELDPKFALAYELLGAIYDENGQSDKTEECYLKAIEIDPTLVNAIYDLGNTYRSKKEFDKAEECYLKAISLDSNFSEALSNLGLVYDEKGESDKAEECYLKAIELNPQLNTAFNNLGCLYENQEKFNKAEECYLKAIEIDPTNTDSLINYGFVCLNQEKYDKAEEYYLKALEINPNYNYACFDIGILYNVLGKEKEKAFNYIKKAADSDFAPACIYAASYYYDGMLSFEKTVAYLEKASKLNSSEAYLELGNLYSLKDKEKALKYYNLAKENGFDCDYEINSIKNGSNADFFNKINELANSSINKNSIVDFCKSCFGQDFEKLQDVSKTMVIRCITEYVLERQFEYSSADYSSAILNLAKAIENELDKYLGRSLVKYIKDDRTKSRTLVGYSFEYRKETRYFDEAHLNALRDCFKSDLFEGTNGDVHLTNYITNLVNEVKQFSETRNAAAHKGTINREKCEKWIDKMIGSGHVLQNYLHNLKQQ